MSQQPKTPCYSCSFFVHSKTFAQKNYIFLDCDWLKNSYFSLIHLRSCYSLLSDSSISQSHSKLWLGTGVRALAFVFLAPN